MTGNYFQLSMRRLGFSRINTNLLSVPYNVFTIINLLLITIASELFDSRAILASSESFWFAPFYIALYAMSNITPWAYFAIS